MTNMIMETNYRTELLPTADKKLAKRAQKQKKENSQLINQQSSSPTWSRKMNKLVSQTEKTLNTIQDFTGHKVKVLSPTA
jgi:hypothetical protein